LVDAAKASPGRLTFGMPHRLETHLAAENFLYQAKADAVSVPTKAKAGARRAGRRRNHLRADQPGRLDRHVNAGRLRALGITSRTEAPQLPGVRRSRIRCGLRERGLVGIVAPAARRGRIIAKVYQDTKKALDTTEMKSALLHAGAGAGRQFAGSVRHGDEGRDCALGERVKERTSTSSEDRPATSRGGGEELYIRALKRLPPDVKQGFDALAKSETDAGARRMLGTMIRNISVAGGHRQPAVPGHRDPDLQRVDRARGRGGRRRAEAGHPARLRALDARILVRSSIVHPTTRVNEQTSCGRGVPISTSIFSEDEEALVIEMVPKGSGSRTTPGSGMAVPPKAWTPSRPS